jgi:L-lactate dehydrogenase complex protein LldF
MNAVPTSTSKERRSKRKTPTWDFAEAASSAVANDLLRLALQRATGKFDVGRRTVMDSLPESDEVRAEASRVKDTVLADLASYVAEFADSVERTGGKVHWASDGDEANRIISDIAKERGVKRIVKSKSMVSEETALNDTLIGEEFNVVETDLGEYILQISGDRPSHIVVPVVHRTKEEIAEIFNSALGIQLPPDPEKITAKARTLLRREFALADMGITGANFACADTGTIVQVTNEGNGRLTTTWPRIHVVLMGIEKIIPSIGDLPVFLKLLARSATGQPLTVYTNLITGPRGDGEGDGAEELHVVLLDNGRTKVLGSPYREALRCIRCGACLNACPVYKSVGGHAYGGTYPGPIGSVLTPLCEGMETHKHLPHACSLCVACYEACPVMINIPGMLIGLRADQVANRQMPLVERLLFRAWSIGVSSPALYRIGAKLMRWGMKPISRYGWAHRLPKPFHGWTESRDMPLPSAKSFRERWAELAKEADGAVDD